MFPVKLVALALLAVTELAAADHVSVWSGVYTDEQMTRGQAAYASRCARCHREDMTAYNSLLVGDKFFEEWREDTVRSFFDTLRLTMPRDAPGGLSEGAYLDIVAYILHANDIPAGQKELTAETARAVWIEGKQGPAEVPNFALVDLVGCLEKTPEGAWRVTNGSEPVRTRQPNDSAPEALDALRGKPLGSHTFTLIEPLLMTDPAKLRGAKIEAKGFLIRDPKGDRLNPTALQPLHAACPAP